MPTNASTPSVLIALRPGRAVRQGLPLALAGTAVIAASAHVQVPMYPVPMTMQSLAVLLVGMAYGWRLGAATLLLYLAEGLAGLPVFANAVGPAALLGPTAGYLYGFIAAAALAGLLAERGWSRSMLGSAAAMALGHVVLFAGGLLWLAQSVGWSRAAALGLSPFLVGTLVKIGLGAALLPALWSVLPARE